MVGHDTLSVADESLALPQATAMRVESRPACVSCGGEGDLLYTKLHDNLYSAPGVWSLRKCRTIDCGMLWLDPMPLTLDLSLAYQDYYTHGAESSGSVLFRISKPVYRFLVDCFLLLGGIPMERKRSGLMFLGNRPPATLLDVGCGRGDFLAKMVKRGWAVAGVDFDKDAADAARRLYGIDVRVGTVDTMVASGMTFDVVTASHVIEHVPDPNEFLSQCRRLLRPGGCMILRTPNVESFGHRRYGSSWRGLEPPRHLHLFTASSLGACGVRAGFKYVRCFTSSIGAEAMLIASRCLMKLGSYRPSKLSRMETLECKILGPLLALRGKIAWLLDRTSGEEICAVFADERPQLAE